MKFDFVLLHNSTKQFSRYNSINGEPAISSKGKKVLQPDKTEKKITTDSLYEVAIGDFIVEGDNKDGTTYITVYKVVDINEDVITGSPC